MVFQQIENIFSLANFTTHMLKYQLSKLNSNTNFQVLHGFLGDWLRVTGNDKYFIIVKKCSSLRYP